MVQNISHLLIIAALFLLSCSPEEQKLEIIVTTDVHGQIYARNPINESLKPGSLSKVTYLVDSLRKINRTLLFDNGDLLQGSPEIYYLNYLYKSQIHPMVEIINDVGYDLMVAGNHDIECGPEIYRRLKTELSIPWLAANVLDKETELPYFKPFHIFEISGKRIAVLGLTTPGVPKWLPEKLWAGLHFQDMIEAAAHWMKIIREKEKADFVVGLFHSGWDATYGNADSLAPLNENASLRVAREVDGFDLIFLGHDHQTKIFNISSNSGKQVIIIDCGSHAKTIGRATLTISKKRISIDSAWHQSIQDIGPSASFEQKYQPIFHKITHWINTPLTYLNGELTTFDALIKPSAYLNLIHTVQLSVTDADISIATPFIYNKTFSGQLSLANIFDLYPYENQLYTVTLSGSEIKNLLARSYSNWFSPFFPNQGLLRYKTVNGSIRWEKPIFSFVTAGGILYTVYYQTGNPPSIRQIRLANGKPFHDSITYNVVVNSYIASGGGGHLTTDIGLTNEMLKKRTTLANEKEFRWLLAEYLKSNPTYTPDTTQNWKIEPETTWKAQIKEETKKLSFQRSHQN